MCGSRLLAIISNLAISHKRNPDVEPQDHPIRSPLPMKNTPRWLRALSWASVAWLGLVWIVGRLIAGRAPLTSAVAYFPQPVLILPALVAPLLLLVRRDWRALAMNSLLVIPISFTLLGFQPKITPAIGVASSPLKVMTYNIRRGDYGWRNVLETIRKEDPDVICLQEANHAEQARIPGYEVVQAGQFVIASKKAIGGTRRVPTVQGEPDGLEATTFGVKFVNVHLSPFSFRRRAKSEPLAVPGHMQDVAKVHARQVGSLLRQYSKDEQTLIVGDFNNPPRGRNYRAMTSAFTDAFASGGAMLGYTFPSHLPLQRIDYVFARGIPVLDAYVPGSRASDHLPTVAILELGS